jgi:taurine dioxygenase
MTTTQKNPDTVQFSPLTPVIGVEVEGVDLSRPATDAVRDRLVDALTEHGVLLFRGQNITPQQQVAFSRNFGELDIHVLDQYQVPGCPEVFVISNVVDKGKHIGAYGGARLFHSDMSYNPEPTMGSLFYCRECPPEGGQTEFASMFAAYEALPEDRRQWLLKQRAVHDYVYHYETCLTHRKPLTAEQKARLSPTTHPAVRTHPISGRNALYISEALTSHFEGMDLEESRRSIRELCAFATEPRFVYRHEWRPGDLVFWDNRSTLHRALPFDESQCRRVMHRTTVKGDRPFLIS